MENISFIGLKTTLKEFDVDGRYAKCGNWSIANGGYDCWWEIYYQGYTVLQCINGELQGGFRLTNFTKETEKQLTKRVKDICEDLKNNLDREALNMTNLEIAKVFNEEESLKQNVLENLMGNNGSISMGYFIFTEDHEPLTEEQQIVLNKYGCDGLIELRVDINLDDLIG